MIEYDFADAAEQARAAADRIADTLADGGAMIVTGGTTPGLLYDALAAKPLPWDRIHLTLSDERWVATDSPDSNEHLVRDRLMRGPAAAAHLTPLKTPGRAPADAVQSVSAAIATLPRPFRTVLLGMGDDGHIASLFPGNAAPTSLDGHAGVLAAPAVAPNGVARLSLTMHALIDAELIVLFIRGDAKRTRLREAAAGQSPHLPVAALLRQARCPVEAYWAP